MRNLKRTLAFAAVAISTIAAASTLYAEDDHESSAPMTGMMDRGTMGGHGMGMMKQMSQMSQMMDQCSGMMQGDHRGGRPNEQWRNR